MVAAVLASAIFAAGCTVPLGPGYRFATRRSEVSSVVAEPAHVHVRVSDALQNVGNRDLSFLDTTPPFPAALGVTRLTVQVAGAAARPLATNADSDATVRISFPSPWPQGQERDVVFEYDLTPNSGSHLPPASTDGFYLADPAALPKWSPPPGPFAYGDSRALDERLQVTVPSDWLVLGVGAGRRKTLPGGLSLHEFRTRVGDVPPFIIAGRFRESRIETSRGAVIIWTLRPLDSEAAKAAAGRLSAAAAAYEDVFGPLPSGARTIRIVEMPGEALSTSEPAIAPPATSFPGGVLLSRQAFEQGLGNESVMRLAESELAQTWLGWRVYPSADSQLSLGVEWFPVVLSAEARGGAGARQRLVTQMIGTYDSDSRDSRRRMHAALFCVALEDLAGKEKFAQAMQGIMRAMRGRLVADEDLRSAIEAETGLHLGETFRIWLHQPGLPADFRARYASKQ